MKCILYLAYPFQNKEGNLPSFFLDSLISIEFEGVHYWAKACGECATSSGVDLLIEHMISLFERVFPEHPITREAFVLFPLLC